jgi:hypothetical protein
MSSSYRSGDAMSIIDDDIEACFEVILSVVLAKRRM